MKGKHDDLIMALAMCLYVGENSFTQLKKADKMTKAMLDGWVSNESEVKDTPVHLRPTPNSDVLRPHIKHNTGNESLYREYGWLFGAKPK